MLFSEHFGLQHDSTTDWFDPLLEKDTRLYVDPFRIYADADPFWAQAHAQLLTFFEMAITLVGEARGNPAHPAMAKAMSLLMFPEPPEFCLGNSQDSIFGAGASKTLRREMIEAINVAIGLGQTDLAHMETLILFSAGMGVDRLSDLVCNVLKSHFIEYTQTTCMSLGVPMQPFRLTHSSWSEEFARWDNGTFDLPHNPEHPSVGVVLTPSRFLRRIPTVDSADFWDFAYADASEELRASMNHDLTKQLPKQRRARLARQNPDLVMAYLRNLEQVPKPAYDLDDDPDNVRLWYRIPKLLDDAVPVTATAQPATREAVGTFVSNILSVFKIAVEDKGLWKILWADGKPRDESTVQLLFRSVVEHRCEAYNVDVSPESNAGRGPVDFKFSTGWESKVLVELKLSSNTGYWSGLLAQTPAYMRSESSHLAYFLSVGFRDRDFTEAAVKRVEDAADSFRRQSGYDVRVITVDARPKESASNLHAPAPPRNS